MVETQVRNRHRLKKKVIHELNDKLNNIFSCNLDFERYTIDSATLGNSEVLFIDNELLALYFNDEPFLSLRGILKFQPEFRFVTVDMGAVKFVTNGADVMSPGIVDADLDIQVGDLVWVRDVQNKKPLAIGTALMTGPMMIESNSDKAVKTLHYIGDHLWQLND